MDTQEKRQPEDYIWDPEKLYAREKNSTRRLIAFILFVLALGAAALLLWSRQRAEAGDVALSSSMSFEEADRKMQEAGFSPLSETQYGAASVSREYDSPRIFGQYAVFSLLEEESGTDGGFRVTHVFREEIGSSVRHPGSVYSALKQGLIRLHGEPDSSSEAQFPYLRWDREDSSVIYLTWFSDDLPVLCYLYPRTKSL
jgi:hypothetical protein